MGLCRLFLYNGRCCFFSRSRRRWRKRIFRTDIIANIDHGILVFQAGRQKDCFFNQIIDRMNPKVDWYFTKNNKWQEETEALRAIALDCNLNEELKWGCPCYTFKKSNIVLIHVFKEYCAFLFFKGALLKDNKKILIQQTENVQAARQVRFTSVKGIKKLEKILKSYIHEAIEVEKAGVKVPMKKRSA